MCTPATPDSWMGGYLMGELRNCEKPLLGRDPNPSHAKEVARLKGDLSTASDCAQRAFLQVLTMPSNHDVLEYFYAAPPGLRFRLPACKRGSMRTQTHDYLWSAEPGAKEPCFWGNMLYSKSVFIILLARLLGVTYIVESGRMGAISLTHYHHFGFNLTSVEYMPIARVSRDLALHLPSVRLLDGDGSQLVPMAVDDIYASDPAARILAIIDGPKGAKAVQLAGNLSERVQAVILDDQAVDGAKWLSHKLRPALSLYTLNDHWLRALPRERDFQLAPDNAGAHGHGRHVTTSRAYFYYPFGATALLWGGLQDRPRCKDGQQS